jgi:hypothetical protein
LTSGSADFCRSKREGYIKKEIGLGVNPTSYLFSFLCVTSGCNWQDFRGIVSPGVTHYNIWKHIQYVGAVYAITNNINNSDITNTIGTSSSSEALSATEPLQVCSSPFGIMKKARLLPS